MIFADGGTRNNQSKINVGGWGVVIVYGEQTKEFYGNDKNTSNNKMELTAVIKALEHIKSNDILVEVYSDSKYVIQGVNEWSAGWIARDWVKADKKPVLNKELWQRLLKLRNKQDNIKFIWIKGHSTNEGNILADALANKGMDALEKKQVSR